MTKLQRWVDLLAALLRRAHPVSLEELKEDVPGYLSQENLPALRRAFERDKAELREFGVPILTIKDANDEVMGYQLKRDAFYLPYLSLIQDQHVTSTPERVDRYGYRALPELSFESDELTAVAEAARRVSQLGDPALTTLARSAMRKLAFDLPVDASVREPGIAYGTVPGVSPAQVLQELDDALRRRKRVTIEYHTFASDTRKRRVVSPFGLFFLGSHWYLAAREDANGPVKNFRVSRISDAEVNKAQPDTHDFEIPPTFDLRSHASSRQSWELGDAGSIEAVVEFRGSSGPTMAARRLGVAVSAVPAQRRFQVRLIEPFVRWLLSFAGEAVPLSPPEVTKAYRKLAKESLAGARESA
jgi:proteasome accessory factor B